MPPKPTFFEFLEGAAPTEPVLASYLSRIIEWERQEFKACATDVGLPFRKAVCAFANSRGGEVFVGVDNAGDIIGSAVTSQQIAQALGGPDGPDERWFADDANRAVGRLTPVPLDKGTKQVVVVEVRRSAIAILCRVDGRRELLLRKGESVLAASGPEAIEWYRARTRETMLRTIHREIQTATRRLSTAIPRYVIGETDFLPFVRARMTDGTLYDLLTSEDQEFIIGGKRIGCLSSLLELRSKLQSVQYKSADSSWSWHDDPEVHQALVDAEFDLRGRLADFEQHLKKEGLL